MADGEGEDGVEVGIVFDMVVVEGLKLLRLCYELKSSCRPTMCLE